MINFLLESTISLVVLLAFYYLFLEREKMHQFNRFYLLISIVISLVVPFVSIEIILENENIPLVTNFPILIDSGNNIPVKETTNYTTILLWSFYTVTSLILLLRFLKNILYFKKTIQINEKVSYKKATLVLLNQETIPHTFLNYIFLNKESYINKTIENELFEHELTHVNQNHSYDILCIELLKIIFWFNPVFYFYKKAIQLNHEFIADENVIKTHTNVPFYQSLLLSTNEKTNYYLASNLNYLLTKKRLIMMTKTTSKKLSTLKKIIIIPMLIGLIYFFSIEVIAKEKKIEKQIEKVSNNNNKEKDNYFNGTRIIKAEKAIIYKDTTILENILIDKLYENLTDYEYATLGDKWFKIFKQKPFVKKSPTQKELNEYKNSKKYAIWIDGVNVPNSELNKYKPNDIAHFSGSVILKNARTKKHPQPFQYWFSTHNYFEKNKMGETLNKYPGEKIIWWNVGEKRNENYKK